MILMLMIHSSFDHFLRSSFQAESHSSEAEARAEAEETKRATGEDWVRPLKSIQHVPSACHKCGHRLDVWHSSIDFGERVCHSELLGFCI